MLDDERYTELGDRLKEEVRENAPAFSELLHQRVMSEIRRHDNLQRTGITAPSRFRRIVAWSAVAAAVICAAFLWNTSPARRTVVRNQPRSNRSHHASPVLSLPNDDLLLQAVMPAEAQLKEAQYAYLDHDVSELEQFVASQMTFSGKRAR